MSHLISCRRRISTFCVVASEIWSSIDGWGLLKLVTKCKVTDTPYKCFWYLLGYTWCLIQVLPLGAWWTSVRPDGPPSQLALHLSFSMPIFHHSRYISCIFYFLTILLNASTFCCSLLSLGKLVHGLTTLKAMLFFLISVLECFSLRFVQSLSAHVLSPSLSWNRTFGSTLSNPLTNLNDCATSRM